MTKTKMLHGSKIQNPTLNKRKKKIEREKRKVIIAEVKLYSKLK